MVWVTATSVTAGQQSGAVWSQVTTLTQSGQWVTLLPQPDNRVKTIWKRKVTQGPAD